MHMSGPSGDDWCWKKARLKVLVGSIRHNILSITSLADSGWRFTQGPKGFDLFHEKLGMHCLDVAYFANCPWVRLHPDGGSSTREAPTPSPKIISVSGAKNEPKTSPMHLLVLIITIFPFLFR